MIMPLKYNGSFNALEIALLESIDVALLPKLLCVELGEGRRKVLEEMLSAGCSFRDAYEKHITTQDRLNAQARQDSEIAQKICEEASAGRLENGVAAHYTYDPGRALVNACARVSFEDRDRAKAAGFRWDAYSKHWIKTMKLAELTHKESV